MTKHSQMQCCIRADYNGQQHSLQLDDCPINWSSMAYCFLFRQSIYRKRRKFGGTLVLQSAPGWHTKIWQIYCTANNEQYKYNIIGGTKVFDWLNSAN